MSKLNETSLVRAGQCADAPDEAAAVKAANAAATNARRTQDARQISPPFTMGTSPEPTAQRVEA
jgi:hypothetical protein